MYGGWWNYPPLLTHAAVGVAVPPTSLHPPATRSQPPLPTSQHISFFYPPQQPHPLHLHHSHHFHHHQLPMHFPGGPAAAVPYQVHPQQSATGMPLALSPQHCAITTALSGMGPAQNGLHTAPVLPPFNNYVVQHNVMVPSLSVGASTTAEHHVPLTSAQGAPDRSIRCRHFLDGKCNRRKCRFSHDAANVEDTTQRE
jgi:hypothetical protein